jgi:hypothetical protein
MDRFSTQPSIVELGESRRSRVLVASIYGHNDGTYEVTFELLAALTTPHS